MDYFIQQSSFSVYFNKAEEIRRHIFDFEQSFTGRFIKPFQLNSVADNAPSEIPRIIGLTQDGSTTLQVSQVSLTILEKIGGEKPKGWPEICREFKEYISLAYSSLENNKIDSFLYAGLTLHIYFPMSDNESVIDFLLEKFLSHSVISRPSDINVKFTFTEKNQYYYNYNLSNKIEYQPSGPAPRMIPAYLKASAFGLMLVLDINDRYAFNFNREYLSEKNEGLQILQRADNLIQNRLSDMLESGKITHG